MKEVIQLLKTKNILSFINTGILVCPVYGSEEGLDLGKEILYLLVDRKTTLFLSGGNTPKELYKTLAKEEKLIPGAVGLVDERFSPKFHENSNETMIRDSGLLNYFHMRDIRFSPIITAETDLKKTAEDYDQVVRGMHATFQNSLAILGIGKDGHTAGLLARNSEFRIQNSELSEQDQVSAYLYPDATYQERISMTFLGLSMIDVLLILVFGDDKKQALKLTFNSGKEEDIPARFFTRPDIACKTILITDQGIEL